MLGAALACLEDFMRTKEHWGEATFYVYDGGVEVGIGVLGVSID